MLFIKPGECPIFFDQVGSKQQILRKDKFGYGGLEQKCMLLYKENKAFTTFDFSKAIFTSFMIRFGSQLVAFFVTGALNES